MAAIGIMGGTFDPIHYGHLLIAEESRVEFDLDKVLFVTSGQPPHKKDYAVSDAEQRHAMAILATEGNSHFEPSRTELDREGPSYAVDTVEECLRTYGSDAELYFITGADAILEILTWHQPERLRCMCKFIAAARPGYDFDELRLRLPREFLDQIICLETPGIHISSTELRARVKTGKSIRYMVPEPVRAYIEHQRLYK